MKKYLFLFPALMLLSSTYKLDAKEYLNYGHIYYVDIDMTNSSSTPIAVTTYINNLFIQIGNDMAANPTLNETYTILFPKQTYIIDEMLYFYFTGLGTLLDNKTLNIIGLTTNLTDFNNLAVSHVQGSVGVTASYINTHYAKTNITFPNGNDHPDATNYMNAAPGTDFPSIASNIEPHKSLLWIDNAVTPPCSPTYCTRYIKNNTINLMGLKFTSPVGSTQYIYPNMVGTAQLYPETYPPTVLNPSIPVYAAVYIEYMKNTYVDNIQIVNTWGKGIRVNNNIDEAHYNFQTNNEIVIKQNIIKNTLGRNSSAPAPSTYGIMLLGSTNSTIEENFIYNDLSITGTKQIAPGIGICLCELDKNMMAKHNWVHGYEFSFWMEGASGGMNLFYNRSSATEHGLVVSQNISFSTPSSSYLVAKYEHNYFTNIGLDPNYLDYCGEYNNNFNRHIFFDGGTVTNNFISFKHNTINIDESLYIFQKIYPSDVTPAYYTSSGRLLFDDQQQDYLEINCNQFINSNSAASTHSNVQIFPPATLPPNGWHGWLMQNEFNNSTTVTHSCDPIHQGNTYPNTGTAPNCIPASNTLLTGCDRDYEENDYSIGGGMLLDYSIYDGCDDMSGTISFNVTGGIPPYEFLLDGEKIGIGMFENGTLTNVTSGVHTLTVNDSGVPSTGSFVFTMNSNPHIFFGNKTSSELIDDLTTPPDPDVTFLNDKFIQIANSFTVDENFTFNNCIFYLKPNAVINVLPSKTITFTDCTFKASCDGMWDGIYADAPQAQIVLSGCTLRDMEHGIVLKNGAKTNCQNNTFIDNFVGMHFENTPAGYVSVGGNKGIVLNNTFTSSGNNLLIPQQTETLACTGIEILNCKELEIGELVSHSNNTFNTIRTGINIVPKANDYNIIRLLNNNYLNIHKDFSAFTYPEEELTKKFYTKDKGAGIFVPNPNSPNSSNSRIVHVEALPNDGRFEDCDKAFAANNISANVIGYTIQNCKGGLLFNDARAQLYWVESNNIDNAFIGMQFLGNLQKAVVANHMSTYGAGIATQKNPIAIDPAQNAGNDRLWPKGIDIEFTDYKHMGQVLIDNNAINLRAIGGKGIALSLTGPGVTARNNSVVFTTQDKSDDEGVTMVGIQSLLSLGNHLNCNAITGYYNNAVWQKRNSQGIVLYQTGQSNVDCNTISNTWHGTLAYGDNTTDTKNVKGNTYNHHAWGMLFAPSIFTPEGTFGDIGSSTADNNNRFNGSYANPGGWNVYRFCNSGSTILPSNMYTSQPILSGSFNGWPYNIILAPTPYDCENSECIMNNEDPHNPFIDEENAEDLVNNVIQFPYFPEVGEWVAERRLFADLDEDSVARLSNTLLNTFYIQKSQETMGDILMAEKALNLLSDSLSSSDSTVYDQRLTNAITANNAISSIHNYEQNERIVNYLYLKIAMIGRNSLDSSDLETLETLAKSCPAIEGTAVYKARTLYAMYEPALDYNDLELCGSGMSNKNGGSSHNNLQDFLNRLPSGATIEYTDQSSIGTHDIFDLEFSVSPNPASSILLVKYALKKDDDATMKMFDVFGDLVRTTTLSSGRTEIMIDVQNLIPGLYTYNVIIDGHKYIGKISILR